MVTEARATYQDLANRRHFTEAKKPIDETRRLIGELSAPSVPTAHELQARTATSATNMQQAADNGYIETG